MKKISQSVIVPRLSFHGGWNKLLLELATVVLLRTRVLEATTAIAAWPEWTVVVVPAVIVVIGR